MAKNELPEGLSPETQEQIREARPFETLEDDAENVYDSTLPGAHGQHGWDIMYPGWETVRDVETLRAYIEFAGYKSVEEFKREEVYRSNVDRPDMKWLRDL